MLENKKTILDFKTKLFMSNLIVYFSRAGSNWVEDGVKNIEVGNTKLLANLIQSKVGGDIFEIQTMTHDVFNFEYEYAKLL